MKTVTPTIAAYLAALPQQLQIADAYTFTLVSGQVLRYTTAQAPFTLGAKTFLAAGPLLQRSAIRQVRGVEVDTLDITVADSGVTMAALRAGAFDGAQVLLQRVFFTPDWAPVDSTGTADLILFSGYVGEVDVGRLQASIRCNSVLRQLNTQMPRNLYQPGCGNTVYDSVCGVSKVAFTTTSTAATGSTAAAVFATGVAAAAGYFNQGVATFTSGANAGQARTIRTLQSGVLIPVAAWPFPVAAGDTLTLRPGCDKTQATCTAKFNNVARFRGYPYIPVVTSVTPY